MNDAFRFCSDSPLPDASRPLAIDLDTDASGVVSYPGAEEIRGRADVPLAGTPQAPDENPGNKPPQIDGASEGI